jgi:Secretion system C-terminal sorting domain/PKD domain
MKKIVLSFKTLLMAMIMPLVFQHTGHAQVNCQLNIGKYPAIANTSTLWFNAFFTDNSCNNPASTYNWTFGDGTSGTGAYLNHTYAQPGWKMVCVSTVTASGTPVTTCDSVLVSPDSSQTNCDQGVLSFTTNPVQGTANTLNFDNNTNLTSGCFSANTSFTWIFGPGLTPDITVGNQSVQHTFPGPGTYQVFIRAQTLSGGIAVNSGTAIVQSTAQTIALGGFVHGSGVCTGSPVKVELYGISDNSYQTMNLSSIQDSCFYYFNVENTPGAPAKNYIIRATPLSGNDYLPTYYGNTLFWENASVIQPTESLWNLNIDLLPSIYDTNGTGPGLVIGSIGGNGTVVNSVFNSSPISTTFDVTASRVIITNSAGQPVGFAIVNSNGTFSYPNLPVGQYFLRVDNPKVPSVAIPFVISANSATMNMNFSTTANGISNVTANGKTIKVVELNAFPNPANDEISVSGTKGNIQIINSTGQVVLETTKGQNIRISNLASGLYTIRAKNSKNEPVNTRFVKK